MLHCIYFVRRAERRVSERGFLVRPPRRPTPGRGSYVAGFGRLVSWFGVHYRHRDAAILGTKPVSVMSELYQRFIHEERDPHRDLPGLDQLHKVLPGPSFAPDLHLFLKQRQNRRPQKRVLCFEIAWTDPKDFGKKNWVDRDDVRTVA